jgi:hypothetical protein
MSMEHSDQLRTRAGAAQSFVIVMVTSFQELAIFSPTLVMLKVLNY